MMIGESPEFAKLKHEECARFLRNPSENSFSTIFEQSLLATFHLALSQFPRPSKVFPTRQRIGSLFSNSILSKCLQILWRFLKIWHYFDKVSELIFVKLFRYGSTSNILFDVPPVEQISIHGNSGWFFGMDQWFEIHGRSSCKPCEPELANIVLFSSFIRTFSDLYTVIGVRYSFCSC